MFYPVFQQVSEQGSQRNKNVLSCLRTGFSTLSLFFILLKTFYTVENLVEKPVGEQDKTHEFSHSRFFGVVPNFVKVGVGHGAWGEEEKVQNHGEARKGVYFSSSIGPKFH